MVNDITKNCSKCKMELEITEFNADSRRKDGKRASCRACDADHKKGVRDANLDEYRKKNREANRIYRKRLKNKDIDE